MAFGLGLSLLRKATPLPEKRKLDVVRGQSYLGHGCTFTGRGFSGSDDVTVHGARVDVKEIRTTGTVTIVDTMIPSPAARAIDISPDADPDDVPVIPHIAGKSVRIRGSQLRVASVTAREQVEIDETSKLIADRVVCRDYLPQPGSVVRGLIAHGAIPDFEEIVVVPAEPPKEDPEEE